MSIIGEYISLIEFYLGLNILINIIFITYVKYIFTFIRIRFIDSFKRHILLLTRSKLRIKQYYILLNIDFGLVVSSMHLLTLISKQDQFQ